MFKSGPDISSLIQQFPLFSSLSRRERRLVAENSTIREYKKGQIIYNEGDPPDAFYYIISGRIQIFTHDPKKAEVTLEYIHRGDYFGIISLLTGEPHSVSTRVINDAIILKIDKPQFDIILKRIPSLAIHFSHALSRRLKCKDLHVKTIFESTIISIYSPEPGLGCTTYAINLGQALRRETGKNVILVDISQTGDIIFKFLDIKGIPLPDLSFIKEHIYNHPSGIDIIGVNNRSTDMAHIPAILSYLTNDYHYVLVDLPHEMNDVNFKALTQADLIHILFKLPEDIRDILSKLEKSIHEPHERIKLCLVNHTDAETIENLLGYKIYATLIKDASYPRTIRRIARETGKVLVGLALSSGAAYGLAHIGVLKVLEEEKIPIDIITGSSMGALISIFWASGMDAVEIEKIAMKYNSRWAFSRLVNLTFPRYGFISGRNIMKFLHTYLGEKTFMDVRLPVKVTACDIINRKRIVIDKGLLADAVRASISIPGLFKPVITKDTLLIDGAIFTPVPVDILTELGVKKIIAVSVIPSPEEILEAKEKRKSIPHSSKGRFKEKFIHLLTPNILDVVMNSMHIMQYNLARINCEQADIVIRPIVPNANWYDFFNPVDLIKKGEEEARRALPYIKALLSE